MSLPFTRLGHYEIVSRIGRGGMGDVYLGYERSLDRKVAIKVLPAELARDGDFVRRFKSEASAAAKLIHPHVVRIYVIGEEAGYHFFAMQYVEGESLAGLLGRKGKLSVDETLRVAEQLLSGLSAAHRQGLVHRDIKPGNILLDREQGRALLGDFGLVKLLDATPAGKTATGVIMGTLDYIPPEQARGQPIDARSDLYSLGVLLFQMLSGRLPFQADTPAALLFQHVYEAPPPLESLEPGIPLPLTAIVGKLLSKSVTDRHASADEVLADLRAVRTGAPLPSGADRPKRREQDRQPSNAAIAETRAHDSGDQFLPGKGPRRWAIAIKPLVIGSLALAVIVATVVNRRAWDAQAPRDETRTLRGPAEGQPAQQQTAADRPIPAELLAPLVRRLPFIENGLCGLVFAPSGGKLLALSKKKHIDVVATENWGLVDHVSLAGGDRSFHMAAFSADRRFVAIASSGETGPMNLQVRSAETGRLEFSVPEDFQELRSLALTGASWRPCR